MRSWWRGGEWMRGLGLDFTNPVGTGGVLGVFWLWWYRWVGVWTRVWRCGVV